MYTSNSPKIALLNKLEGGQHFGGMREFLFRATQWFSASSQLKTVKTRSYLRICVLEERLIEGPMSPTN